MQEYYAMILIKKNENRDSNIKQFSIILRTPIKRILDYNFINICFITAFNLFEINLTAAILPGPINPIRKYLVIIRFIIQVLSRKVHRKVEIKIQNLYMLQIYCEFKRHNQQTFYAIKVLQDSLIHYHSKGKKHNSKNSIITTTHSQFIRKIYKLEFLNI